MKNWKLELFNFKQSLTLEQLDEANIVAEHLKNFDRMSEREVAASLNERLKAYSYDNSVKAFLESLQEELEAKPLTYELKDLYKKVERKNYGLLYREPLNRLLHIISMDDDDAKMEHIVNELAIFDWVPEIKQFMASLTKDPIERQNMKNSGKGDEIYTIVENVEDGHVAYIADRWFLLGDKEIKQTLLENHVGDQDKVRSLRMLEQALKMSEINGDMMSFQIDENLSLGISTKDGKLYINGDAADKETTLENVFNSPIVPYLKKNHYVILNNVKENLDKFVNLDIGIKTSNILKPHLECYAFNYKDKMYIYNRDSRTGSSFFEYESVNSLIRDVQKELDYDLTPFFENKLSKELRYLRGLEDKEQKIQMKIDEVNESIKELKENEELMAESKELKMAFDNLLIYKHNLTKSLNDVRSQKNDAKRTMIV